MVIASSVGQGRGEIIEFVVLPSSPAIGVPLSQQQASGWRIAAIYRGGDLVIPTGETAIQAEDRIPLIGDPTILTQVAEQIRVGVPQFPLRHGKSIVLYRPASAATLRRPRGRARGRFLTRRTRAQSLVRLFAGAQAERPSSRALAATARRSRHAHAARPSRPCRSTGQALRRTSPSFVSCVPAC